MVAGDWQRGCVAFTNLLGKGWGKKVMESLKDIGGFCTVVAVGCCVLNCHQHRNFSESVTWQARNELNTS